MTIDASELPMIDAVTLFARVGVEAVCGIPLPDGSLPITGQWRMDEAEWRKYRGFCGEAQTINRRALGLVCI